MNGRILQVCAVGMSVDKLLSPLLKSIKDEGFELHIACADDGNIEKLRERGYIVHNIHFERKISFVSNLKSIRQLYRLMKLNKYDIVHTHTPVASILARIAAKLAGIKNIIYTAHGYYFHEGMNKKQYNFYYQVEKQFARYATDYLLLQSKEDYQLSINKNFKKSNRIIHLGNGVEIYNKFNPFIIEKEKSKELKKEFNIETTDIVYTFIGRFVREKGIYDLVEAFEMLAKQKPNVKLMLIGGLLESERDQEIKEALHKWKLNKNIILPGFRSDIPILLDISDVFILPSYREGLPRSIIEAMAMAKPIIATNIRGCREQVINDYNGYLFEPGDIKSLMSKMLDMNVHDDKRIKMGIESRQIVEQYYDENKVLQKQIELYKKL